MQDAPFKTVIKTSDIPFLPYEMTAASVPPSTLMVAGGLAVGAHRGNHRGGKAVRACRGNS